MSGKDGSLIRKVSAVVVSSIVENRLSAMLPDSVPVGQMIFGFDPTDPANEADVLRVDEKGTRDWTQHTTEPFLLRTWAAHKVEKPDEDTGEMKVYVRVVLLDPDGETLTFGSKGVVQSLDMIRTLRGDGPYDPPLKITVVRIALGGERQYLKLRLKIETPVVKKK